MILIVEDDRDIREFLGELLQAEGYSVVLAANGNQARERLESPPLPSLILLDLMMPELDGWALSKELKCVEELARIPVILVSGLSDVRHEADSLNAIGYLRKPFDMDNLLELIEKAGLSKA